LANATLSKTIGFNPLSAAQYLFQIMYPLAILSQVLTAFFTSSLFVRYCNDWSQFETIFHQTFHSYPIFKKTTWFRNVFGVYVTIFGLSFGFVMQPWVDSQNKLAELSMLTQSYTFNVVMLGSCTILIGLWLDLRNNVMLFINGEAFSEVCTKTQKAIT
jgi:hypothetical protein